jgi:hypothetical protein
VPEAEGLLLADRVHVGELRDRPDGFQLLDLPLLPQEGLELGRAVEMVVDRGLAPSDDDQDVVEPGAHGLLDDQLDRRHVDHGQHHLGLRLRGRQEPGPESRRGDHRLANLHPHPSSPAGLAGRSCRQVHESRVAGPEAMLP